MYYNDDRMQIQTKTTLIKKENTTMKMIYAIVHSADGDRVTEELNRKGFSVTRLSTTGGFLRRGNSTLMTVTDDEKVDEVISIFNVLPVTVDVGGTTIFVVNVERFEKS